MNTSTTPKTTMDDTTYQRVAVALLKEAESFGTIEIRGDGVWVMTKESWADWVEEGDSKKDLPADASPFWFVTDDDYSRPINNSDDLAPELANMEYSLLDAALYAHDDAVKALIEGGADLEACDRYGITPLMITTVPVIKKMLCEGGALVDARDTVDGMTALHRAAERDDTDSIQVLLDAGAQVDAQTNYGLTALHYAVLKEEFATDDFLDAAERDATKSIRVLLAGGAQVDAQDCEGGTALMRAAVKDDTESIPVLLAAGADPTLVNRRGETAEYVAKGKAKDILITERVERERGILRRVVGLNDTEEPVQRSRRM